MENLKGALRQKHITVDMVATLLGIHRNTAAAKINGSGEFTVSEAFYLKCHFLPEYDMAYLFQKN